MDRTVVNFLLVEDDEVDARAVKRAFNKRKVSNPIHVARDGVEALAMLRGEDGFPPFPRPFLILLDLNMPRMNGIQFLDELRKDPELHSSIVFVLTTSNADKDKVAAYEKNVAGYLLKSNAGTDFLSVLQLLENYVISVQFPPNSEH